MSEPVDQAILNQTDLGRIRKAIEELNSKFGETAHNEAGEAIGGTGLIGDFNRLRTKVERRFSLYDRWGWILTGVAATVAISATVIWWLISPAAPVNELRARPAVVETRQ